MKQLGIFAKYWQAGAVKTRLAAAIGPQAASELYHSFVKILVRRFEDEDVAQRKVLSYWPRERRREFAELSGRHWQLAVQSEGDLGQRMRQFFHRSFGSGSRSVVLIGSDSPTLPLDYLQQAFRLLESSPVVLGPTEDGGYYLVGASNSVPPIFEGIAWSTPTVWEQTVSQLQNANVPFAELPPWYDIDRLEDVYRLDEELNGLSRRDPAWCDLRHVTRYALACTRN